MRFQIITEAARRNNEIKDKILFQQDECIMHLMCMFLYRDDENCLNHWPTEIRAFISKISKTKSSKKFPTYNQLYEWLMSSWADCFDIQYRAFLEDIEDKENKYIPQFNLNNMYNFIYDYFDWLAKHLSQYGLVTRDDVKLTINNLLTKYTIL